VERNLDQPVIRTRSHMSVRELARRLGVSSATVSRALNNHAEISDETRARVLEMADKTGYHFRVGKRFTNVIGLVYPTDPVSPDDGSFETAMLAGVLAGVNEQRFDVQVINVERDKSMEETYTQFFRRKGVRGVIVRSIRPKPVLAELIADEGFPCVLIADRSDHPNVNFIRSESRADSARVIDHLIHYGHSRIAIAMHGMMDSDHRDRRAGYVDGLERNGISIDESLIIQVGGRLQSGASAIDRLLANQNPPTAVYFTTPPATVGALQRCLELGIKVPDDLSIVGFDDSSVRMRSFPNFTAVCQDAAQLGLEASRWLTRNLEGMTDGPLRVERPTYFSPNQSTGVCPSAPTRLHVNGRVERVAAITNQPRTE